MLGGKLGLHPRADIDAFKLCVEHGTRCADDAELGMGPAGHERVFLGELAVDEPADVHADWSHQRALRSTEEHSCVCDGGLCDLGHSGVDPVPGIAAGEAAV